jgi:protoporphyrinogen/coproporphyrinogen III oxidase
MSHMSATGPRIVVVGAGISGLAAAYALHRDGPPGTTVTVLEGSDRIGGKLHASAVGELDVDEGAETFLARAPHGVALVEAVGLGADLVAPATTSAAVVVRGAPRPLPTGTLLGVPADLAALAAAGVLDGAALAAVRAEVGRPGEPVDGDVAVGEYVRRRLGAPVVDLLVDPLLGGVYAGRADLLSLRATIPALARLLTGPGPVPSLINAARAARLASAPSGASGLAVGAGPEGDVGEAEGGGTPGDEGSAGLSAGAVFATLRGGMGALPAAVAAASGAEIRLRTTVRRIERTERGFRLTTGPVPAPAYLDADAVIVAVPAAKAAPMVADLVPAAAAELAAIPYASIAIVTLGYRPGKALLGSGLLVPAAEGRAVKALTHSSTKWPHLSGDLRVVRASVGRYGEEKILHRDDSDLIALVTAEVAALSGIDGAPVVTRVTRWGGALPQYGVGHSDKIRRIRDSVATVKGVGFSGAAYDGVGVPACIGSGYAAAAKVLSDLTGPAG